MDVKVLDDDAYITLATGLDWSALSLSQEQAILLTKIAGRTRVGEVVSGSGMPEARAQDALVGLVKCGALLMEGEALAKAAEKAKKEESGTYARSAGTHNEFRGFVFSPADMAESVDIDDHQRKRILYVHAHLEEWNHYALLGLKRTAKGSDIKRGYFKASKEFHPDAYFRKELGTLRPRLGEVFRAMKSAYDVLSNAERRQEYDGTLGADFTPEELAELEARASEKREVQDEAKRAQLEVERAARRLERLAERKKAKRIERNPMLDAIKKGREYAELARKSFESKDMKAASRHARMALQFSRGHKTVEEIVQPILVASDRAQAEILVRQVQNMLSPEDDKLRDLAERVAELAHGSAKILIDAAAIYNQIKDVRAALKMAQMATHAEPDEIKGWVALLDYAERGDQPNTALRAAERVLELDPKRPGVKDTLKRLRREVR